MENYSTHSVKQISKEEFFQVLEEHNIQQKRLDTLAENGFPLWDSDLIEYGHRMFERYIGACFTEEGVEWICWWLYELPSLGSNGPHATDKNGNPIPTETLDDLWNLVEEYRRS